jgi:tetratricopeptide (TPR) repeat protein
LKTTIHRYIIGLVFLAVLMACSTKKDKFLNRNFQALNTEFNVLYNGDLALQEGITTLKSTYRDNYWQILPVERLEVKKDAMLPGETKNASFERAEDKATKAIQKRSMLIGGSEKNPQIDEAYLLLGKSRYYDQRFVPALEAFNYILYKYPQSDKIYIAKIWREKTNIRLENEGLAVANLTKLLDEIKFKDQVFADANASLAQAYYNLEQKDSAVSKLKIATKFTKEDEEKARYRFITGQIYESLQQPDSAFAAFQSVIDMKRRSPRQYVIQAHAKQAQQFDYKNGDTLAFVLKYNKLIEDRENRPFLDVLYHQKALFYDKQNKDQQAVTFYNKSLKSNSQDQYLIASNYRNLAELYFNNAKYQTAGNYYDSTLVVLQERTREFNAIKKKRDNLQDVIKYEGIAQRNDSILNVLALSKEDQYSFYQEYADKLKKEDALKAKLEKERLEREARSGNIGENALENDISVSENKLSKKRSIGIESFEKELNPSATVSGTGSSSFYFYNPTTVETGKLEFKKYWGARALKDNWRTSASGKSSNSETFEAGEENENKGEKALSFEELAKDNPKYNPEFYISQLPQSPTVKDSLAKERNFAYYQLGLIYKEKFKEYQLAADRLEILLRSQPEERLVLPGMYNLYKVYEIIDKNKAATLKNKIIQLYPDSRYAQLLQRGSTGDLTDQDPEVVYASLYKMFEKGDYRNALAQTEESVNNYSGEEIISKFEYLKAILNGKLKGLADYKIGLNYVALNYPNSIEGKEAESFLTTRMPQLENLDFDQEVPNSWKILFVADNLEDKKTKTLIEKVTKFIKERASDNMTATIDIYTMDKNFLVIHGIKSEELAKGIASILKEFKDYKIADPSIVISNENYKVVQIKKCLDNYLNPEYVPLEKKTFAIPSSPKVDEKAPVKKDPKQSVNDRNPKQESRNREAEGKSRLNPKGNDMIKGKGVQMMPPGPDLQKKP